MQKIMKTMMMLMMMIIDVVATVVEFDLVLLHDFTQSSSPLIPIAITMMMIITVDGDEVFIRKMIVTLMMMVISTLMQKMMTSMIALTFEIPV